MMATRHHISWDTNTKQLKFTTPTPEAKSRKRTAGTSDGTNKENDDDVVDMQGNDDRVSDGTHHQPPPEKTMRTNASNKAAIVFPHAAVELQSRGRPRKNPLPSRVPAAASGETAKYRGVSWIQHQQKFRAQLSHKKVASHATPEVQQSAKPSSLAIAAPIEPSGEVAKKYRGVCWNKQNKMFTTHLWHNGKTIYVGSSADAKEAAFMHDRARRDLATPLKVPPSKLNFDDTVPVPDEYLASVANASKRVASHVVQQTAQQPSSLAIAAPSPDNDKDGGAPLLEADQHEHEVPPPAASSATTTIIHYHYNIQSGASATFHIYNNSSPAAGIPNTHHHVAQSPPPPPSAE